MTRRQVDGNALGAAEYRQLIDQLPDAGLLVTGRDLRCVLAAGQALARAGWQAGDLLGSRPWELVPGPVAGEVERRLTAALRGETSTLPVLPGPRPGVLWEARLGPLHGGDGAVTGTVLALRDVTAQKQAQEETARLTAELAERARRAGGPDEAARALEAFTSAVSHDLRTPLTALVGYARMLGQEYGDRLSGPGLVYLDRIQSAGQRLDDMIGDLVERSRSGRLVDGT